MRARTLAGFLLLLGMSGCATTEKGSALSVSPSSTVVPVASNLPSSAVLPAHGAPKVASPLDTAVFLAEPCRLLTPAQANRLGVLFPGRSRQGAGGQDCSWNSETGASVGVQFDTMTKLGLSRTYELRDTYKYFIEVPSVEGYPAVAAATVDSRDTGSCQLWVGVSDELVLLMTGDVSRAKQGKVEPCQATETAAAMAVRTMKGEE
jgi:hypothetical protein